MKQFHAKQAWNISIHASMQTFPHSKISYSLSLLLESLSKGSDGTRVMFSGVQCRKKAQGSDAKFWFNWACLFLDIGFGPTMSYHSPVTITSSSASSCTLATNMNLISPMHSTSSPFSLYEACIHEFVVTLPSLHSVDEKVVPSSSARFTYSTRLGLFLHLDKIYIDIYMYIYV